MLEVLEDKTFLYRGVVWGEVKCDHTKMNFQKA